MIKFNEIVNIFKVLDSNFKEEQHPRDEKGRFKSIAGSDKKYSFKNVDPNNIKTINNVVDKNKYNALVYDFKTNGYNGRPVLAVEMYPGYYEALTGSHRILAAQKAGIEIPVNVIEYREELDELLQANDDDEREEILEKLYKNKKINKENFLLFKEEIERNLKEFDDKRIDKEYKEKADKLKELEEMQKKKNISKKEKLDQNIDDNKMKEYKKYFNEMVKKYGENSMWSDMSDEEIDKLYDLEAKAYKKR